MASVITKYGRQWSIDGRDITPLDVELAAFRIGHHPTHGGLGKAIHYKRCVEAIWGREYDWHSWAQKKAQALCSANAVGFVGCKDSGKSEDLATWILCNWFADPVNTLCIVTSTDNKSAEQRIWGAIVRRYRQACNNLGMEIGRLVSSQHIIKLDDSEYEVGANSSISLVAAGDQYKEEALKKLQGRKNKRIFLVLDELQDCSPDVTEKAVWNLKGKGVFHVAAACNANSILGPEGKFFEPANGWMSVDEETETWQINVAGIKGIALHMDGEKSPNNEHFEKTGKIKYSYLIKPDDVASAKASLGPTSPTYRRQYKGFWPSADVDQDHVFTEILIKKHHALEKADWPYESRPHKLLGVDPSFTSGGDRFVCTYGEYGKALNGLWTLNIVQQYTLNRPKPKEGEEEEYAYAMLTEVVKLKEKLGIDNENIGVDSSAGGLFWAMGQRGLLKGWLPVDFSGSPSDKPISAAEKMRDEEGEEVMPKDLFVNRTTELMYVLRYFMESNQLRGVTPELAREMVLRKFTHRGKKIILESKKDMKKRVGFSPDLLDSAEIFADVARERFKAVAGGVALEQRRADKGNVWKRVKEKFSLNSARNY